MTAPKAKKTLSTQDKDLVKLLENDIPINTIERLINFDIVQWDLISRKYIDINDHDYYKKWCKIVVERLAQQKHTIGHFVFTDDILSCIKLQADSPVLKTLINELQDAPKTKQQLEKLQYLIRVVEDDKLVSKMPLEWWALLDSFSDKFNLTKELYKTHLSEWLKHTKKTGLKSKSDKEGDKEALYQKILMAGERPLSTVMDFSKTLDADGRKQVKKVIDDLLTEAALDYSSIEAPLTILKNLQKSFTKESLLSLNLSLAFFAVAGQWRSSAATDKRNLSDISEAFLVFSEKEQGSLLTSLLFSEIFGDPALKGMIKYLTDKGIAPQAPRGHITLGKNEDTCRFSYEYEDLDLNEHGHPKAVLQELFSYKTQKDIVKKMTQLATGTKRSYMMEMAPFIHPRVKGILNALCQASGLSVIYPHKDAEYFKIQGPRKTSEYQDWSSSDQAKFHFAEQFTNIMSTLALRGQVMKTVTETRKNQPKDTPKAKRKL